MNAEPCDTCGQPHLLCSKHNKAGGPCGRPPIKGHDACLLHAGKSIQTVRQEVATRRALAELDLDLNANPLDELLTEVQRSAAAVRWLSEKVNELEDADIVFGATRHVQDTSDFSSVVTMTAGVHVWVRLWMEERDRLARVCKLTLDAGVDERRVRLAESQGRLIVDVLRGALSDLGIIESDEVTEVVTRRLRAITV